MNQQLEHEITVAIENAQAQRAIAESALAESRTATPVAASALQFKARRAIIAAMNFEDRASCLARRR